MSAAPHETGAGEGKALSFFKSTAGIVTIAAAALIVITVIVVIAVLATRGGGKNTTETGTRSPTVEEPTETPTTVKDTEEEQANLARATMDKFLDMYVREGFSKGTEYMTASCRDKFCSQNATAPPPDQGDFDVVSASVAGYRWIDDSTIVFKILQRDKLENGSEGEYYREFEMKEEGGNWLVNDCYKLE